jgi:CheY-like chemotaxis protein
MQRDGGSRPFRGRRILVLEDEGLIMLTITDVLEGLGCEIAAAEARAERALAALAALDGARIDAALIDVNLGEGRTSYAVADALAARGIPFAFLTGYGSAALTPEHSARPVLSKPVDDRSLEAMLTRLFASGAAGAE